MTENPTMTYESELSSTLDRLESENRSIPSFSCFTDCARRWFDSDIRRTLRPSVAVLGPGVPEELILAAGAAPYYILGGSMKSTFWSDDLVPRDTDPVSRSMLGFLEAPDKPDFSDTLFIVPVCSDSMRKTAGLLKEQGRAVHIIDLPPCRNDPLAREKWQDQMLRFTRAVAHHVSAHVTVKGLRESFHAVDAASRALQDFLFLSRDREDLITGPARLLVQNSYYYTDDRQRWTAALTRLNRELQGLRKQYAPRKTPLPGILLMGSPVFFPNYKVPFLIQDIGLSTLRNIDAATAAVRRTPAIVGKRQNRDALIRIAADRWYNQDASPAFTANDVLFQCTLQCLQQDRIEGVVYHVLKGQIEYDFALDRLEPLFDRCGIPVFRLETDYQYQDVEQLRIRMEAFSEMLLQNRYREARMAQ